MNSYVLNVCLIPKQGLIRCLLKPLVDCGYNLSNFTKPNKPNKSTSWNTVEIFSNVQLPYFNKRCILEAIGENDTISSFFEAQNAKTKSAKLELLSKLVYS